MSVFYFCVLYMGKCLFVNIKWLVVLYGKFDIYSESNWCSYG